MSGLDTLGAHWDAFDKTKKTLLVVIYKEISIPFTYSTATSGHEVLKPLELLENKIRLAKEELDAVQHHLRTVRGRLGHDVSPGSFIPFEPLREIFSFLAPDDATSTEPASQVSQHWRGLGSESHNSGAVLCGV